METGRSLHPKIQNMGEKISTISKNSSTLRALRWEPMVLGSLVGRRFVLQAFCIAGGLHCRRSALAFLQPLGFILPKSSVNRSDC